MYRKIKNNSTLSAALSILLFCCVSGGKVYGEINNIITIDIAKHYEKLKLDNIVDVEYIPLETSNDFLCESGSIQYIDDHIIVYLNRREGAVLLFDRKGKALKKIKQRGNSGHEYVMLNGVVYDNLHQEIYINDMQLKKIFVYDINGKYLRSFHHINGKQYRQIKNFNADLLVTYSTFHSTGHPFSLISKKDGHKVKDLVIPYKHRMDMSIDDVSTQGVPISKNGKNIFLNEISSDTIYKVEEDFRLTPVFVQTPKVKSFASNPLFLFADISTPQYQLFFTIKKEFDKQQQHGYSRTALIYDKQKRKIYEQDFHIDNDISGSKKSFNFYYGNCEIVTTQPVGVSQLNAEPLLKAYNKKRITNTQLKTIASKMNEDDNPIVVIMKFK